MIFGQLGRISAGRTLLRVAVHGYQVKLVQGARLARNHMLPAGFDARKSDP